jgi:hypothetical protein
VCARRRLDRDLLPADSAGEVRVAVGDRAFPGEPRTLEDDFESGRAEACLSRWEREHAADRGQLGAPSVDGQEEVAVDRAGEPVRIFVVAAG